MSQSSSDSRVLMGSLLAIHTAVEKHGRYALQDDGVMEAVMHVIASCRPLLAALAFAEMHSPYLFPDDEDIEIGSDDSRAFLLLLADRIIDDMEERKEDD